MLIVIMLNVIMMSVAAPLKGLFEFKGNLFFLNGRFSIREMGGNVKFGQLSWGLSYKTFNCHNDLV
jgi:hypothetical protein